MTGPTWIAAKNKGLQHQDICNSPPHLLPFWSERSLNSNLGDGPPSSRSAGFLNKVAIPCPNTLSVN